MALRWRNRGKGKLLCAKYSQQKAKDCYIDDTLHEKLDNLGVICPIQDGRVWKWVPFDRIVRKEPEPE